MPVLAGSRLVVLLVVLTLYFNAGFAANVGVIGSVYTIAETDLLTVIQQRLNTLKATGQIKRINDAFKARSLARINTPPAVIGITPTQTPTHRLFDPSVTLDHDIVDQHGVLLASAGTVINPLKTVTLQDALLFIDGSDPREITWALTHDRQRHGRTKIILIKGPVIHLMQRTHHRLYFDQDGLLVHHFGITHVPAIVYQQGLMLAIDEVKP